MKIQNWTFTVLATVAILVLSFMPVPHVKLVELPFHLGWDKLVHGLEYTALVLAIALDGLRTMRKMRNLRKVRTACAWGRAQWVAVGYAIVLGPLVEAGQEWLTTYRSGRLDDVCADLIGVALGLLIVALVRCLSHERA